MLDVPTVSQDGSLADNTNGAFLHTAIKKLNSETLKVQLTGRIRFLFYNRNKKNKTLLPHKEGENNDIKREKALKLKRQTAGYSAQFVEDAPGFSISLS